MAAIVPVTVFVPARDAAQTIGLCLERIRELSPAPRRVIVLDDHSRDATASLARAAGAEVVAVRGAGGIGAARNLALSLCDTPWLAFLNADCYAEPGWLAALLRTLNAAGAAIAGGRQLEIRRGTLAERWKALHLRQDRGERSLLDPDFLSGGNLLLRLADIGGLRFDPRHAVAYEDVDFCRRARAAGLHLVYEPAAVVHHDHPETLRTLPAKVWSYGASSASLGIRGRTGVVRAFVRMHRRPHDQIRNALQADWKHARIAFLAVDLYLLFASLTLFLAAAIAPSRLRGAPAALRR